MEGKALYVLAGFDGKTEKKLSNIQNKLYEHGFSGTQTKNIPLHITLGSFSTDKEKELIDFLQKLSKQVDSFEVNLSHVGIFCGSRVIFVAPDCNRNLLELKENFGDSYGWTPHTTMLIDNPDVIHEALPAVMKEFTPICGKVTTLYLYEFFPTRHILTVHFDME